MRKTYLQFLIALATALVAVAKVRAHAVWIEPRDGQLVLRFAELGGDFETSPGYLDQLDLPLAFKSAANRPSSLEVSKRSDCFLIATMPRSVGTSPKGDNQTTCDNP